MRAMAVWVTFLVFMGLPGVTRAQGTSTPLAQSHGDVGNLGPAPLDKSATQAAESTLPLLFDMGIRLGSGQIEVDQTIYYWAKETEDYRNLGVEMKAGIHKALHDNIDADASAYGSIDFEYMPSTTTEWCDYLGEMHQDKNTQAAGRVSGCLGPDLGLRFHGDEATSFVEPRLGLGLWVAFATNSLVDQYHYGPYLRFGIEAAYRAMPFSVEIGHHRFLHSELFHDGMTVIAIHRKFGSTRRIPE